MTAFLSHAEINRRFDRQWVLVGDPQTNDLQEVIGGSVLFHSTDRDEVYRKAIESAPARFVVLYTGSIPRETDVIL